jgi:hypothetical protein
MDNCVFQIETALLKFDGLDESEDGKSSVVKRYVTLNPWPEQPFNLVEQLVLWVLAPTIGRANV